MRRGKRPGSAFVQRQARQASANHYSTPGSATKWTHRTSESFSVWLQFSNSMPPGPAKLPDTTWQVHYQPYDRTFAVNIQDYPPLHSTRSPQ